MHIIFLELKAIEFGDFWGTYETYIQIKCDNTTAIAYINEIGGI